MILKFKGDTWSILGNSKVYNENKEIVYIIKRKLFSITKKYKIYDKNHSILYVVRNKFFHLFLHSAFISSNGVRLAKVTRKIAIKDNYSIEGFEQSARIDGSVVGGHYRLIIDENCVAEITNSNHAFEKELIINDEDDASFVVAIFQAIVSITRQNN